MRYGLIMIALCALTACSNGEKDYAASAKCQGQGHQPGTEAFDSCVREETAARLMEEQRREYEMMKQNEHDWKTRRY